MGSSAWPSPNTNGPLQPLFVVQMLLCTRCNVMMHSISECCQMFSACPIFIRKYGAAVSIICFVLEGASVESHRFVLLFPPHTGLGRRRSVLCVGVGVAGGWIVGVYCVVLKCAKSRR